MESSKTSSITTQDRVVLFDGVCGLCNWAVDFLLKVDSNKKLVFSPIQGKYSIEKISEDFRKDLKTIIYSRQNKIYTQSDAVLKILSDVGGIWKIGLIFYFIPKKLRDFLYHFISINRYSWFGKKEACRVPTAEERERFLD